MSETGNRIAVQEGYVLPFQAYRSGARRTKTAARDVDAKWYGVSSHKVTRERRTRRGYGPKSKAYVAQQSKMKKCAKRWRTTNKGTGETYRSFMRGCLKARHP